MQLCQVPVHATCRRESEEGEAGRLEERRLRESRHWSTKNRREGSGSGYKIQGGETQHQRKHYKSLVQTGGNVAALGALTLSLL